MAVRPDPDPHPDRDPDHSGDMVHLTTVAGLFHARVVAARLGADGMLTELRGDLGGTYPLGGEVHVFVEAASAEDARHILLADEAAAALSAVGPGAARPSRRRPRAWAQLAWVLVAVLIALYLMAALG